MTEYAILLHRRQGPRRSRGEPVGNATAEERAATFARHDRFTAAWASAATR